MKVEELPQEGFAECPRYITLMRFAFLTGLSDRPDLLYAWIESGDLPMRTFGTQRLVDMQKLQKRIEEAKKFACQAFRANHVRLETIYGAIG
ncbi:DNA-binding protein [Pseudomonas aeruginosa]|uniref:DNA-binding protein n=1 Tax=Pseudomonas aeruginosa TaxID=287 RepID=UPI003D29B9AA